MNLPQRGEMAEQRGDTRKAGAESMHQPRQPVELRDAVNLARILVEHGYAGFWIWAMRTCCRKLSSMDSSRRTSVGRFTSVVI